MLGHYVPFSTPGEGALLGIASRQSYLLLLAVNLTQPRLFWEENLCAELSRSG